MAHSTLGPSSAGRWMRCPGSVRLTRHLEEAPSEYAAEGTLAHTIAERCLVSGYDAFRYIGEVHEVDGFTFTVTDDMAAYVQAYVDNVRERSHG